MRILLTLLFESLIAPWNQALKGLIACVHSDVIIHGMLRLASSVTVRALKLAFAIYRPHSPDLSLESCGSRARETQSGYYRGEVRLHEKFINQVKS